MERKTANVRNINSIPHVKCYGKTICNPSIFAVIHEVYFITYASHSVISTHSAFLINSINLILSVLLFELYR